MGRTVKFSFESEAEKSDFLAYARCRGMTLPGLAKMALYAFRTRNRPGAHHPPRKPQEGRGAVARPAIPGEG